MKGYLRKRGDTWSFTIDLPRDQLSGKRRQKTKGGFKTKKDAQEALNNFIYELNHETYIENNKVTVGEYLSDWLIKRKNEIRPTTYQSYENHINFYINPELGNIQLQILQSNQVQKFIDFLLEKYKPTTVQGTIKVLKKALNDAEISGLIKKNPIKHMKLPQNNEQSNFRTWSVEESNRFLIHSKNSRINIAYILAIYTGMRKGEVLGLRWRDVDFNARTISVLQTLNLIKGKLTFGKPKSKSSQRRISIPDYVIRKLLEHKEIQKQEKEIFSYAYNDHDLVVAAENGQPIWPRNLQRNFNNLILQSNVPKIRFHDLRHTHATIMLLNGEHPKVVSERLGHNRIGITLDTYSHVLPDMQRESADNFAQIMNPHC